MPSFSNFPNLAMNPKTTLPNMSLMNNVKISTLPTNSTNQKWKMHWMSRLSQIKHGLCATTKSMDRGMTHATTTWSKSTNGFLKIIQSSMGSRLWSSVEIMMPSARHLALRVGYCLCSMIMCPRNGMSGLRIAVNLALKLAGLLLTMTMDRCLGLYMVQGIWCHLHNQKGLLFYSRSLSIWKVIKKLKIVISMRRLKNFWNYGSE